MADPVVRQDTAPGEHLVRDKETGQVQRVDANTALRGIAEGRFQARKGDQYEVADPDTGEVRYVDLTDPANAGYLASVAGGGATQAASTRQAQQAAVQEQYGGVGGQLAAAGLGAARSLTFGASDAIAGELGFREDVKNLREANPYASTIGEVGADVVAGIASLGAGTVGKVAAKTATGAITRAAERAAGIVGKEAAATSAGRIGQAAARLGVEGAVEGAAFGVREGVIEATLNDRPLDAGEVLAGAARGAAFGGVLGAGLGGAGRTALEAATGTAKALGKVALSVPDIARSVVPPRAREAVASMVKGVDDKLAGDVARYGQARGTAEAASQRVASLARRAHGDEVGDFLDRYASSAKVRRAVDDAEGYTEELARRATADIDELDSGIQRIFDEYDRGLKADQVAASMKAEPTHELFERAGLRLDEVDALAENLDRISNRSFRTSNRGKRIAELSRSYRQMMDEIRGPEGTFAPTRDQAAEAYLTIDALKRELGKATAGASKQGGEALADLQGTYESLRQFLEDADTWGDAALMQRAVNEPRSRAIAKGQVLRGKLFRNSGRQRPGGFRAEYEADPAKLARVLKDPASLSSGNDFVVEGLQKYYSDQLQALDALRKTGALDEGASAFVEEASLKLESVLETIKEAAEAAEARSAAGRTQSLIKESGGGEVMTALMAGAGAALGGPLGAVGAGTAAGLLGKVARQTVNDPMRAIRRAHTKSDKFMDRLIQGASDKTRQALLQMRDMPDAIQKLAQHEAVIRTREVLAKSIKGYLKVRDRAVVVGTLSYTTKDYEAAVEAAENPEAVGLPPEAAPVLAAALPATARDRLSGAINPNVHPAAKDKFMRTASALQDPLRVFEDMSKGVTDAVGLASIQRAYPGLWNQAKAQALESVKRNPYGRREQQLMAVFAPELFRAPMGQAAEKAPPQHPAGGKHSTSEMVSARKLQSDTDSTRTPTAALESRIRR